MYYQMPDKRKNSNGFSTLVTFIIVIVLVLAGAGAYVYRDNQAKKQQQKNLDTIAQLQAKISELQAGSSTSNNTVAAVPSPATIDNIKAAITSGNTAALEGYMAENVSVIIAASDGIGNRTAAEATSDLTSYLKNATAPWNFALSSDVLAKFANGAYKAYFKTNTLVGKSANNYIIAFNFDSQGKINGVFMASSADLL